MSIEPHAGQPQGAMVKLSCDFLGAAAMQPSTRVWPNHNLAYTCVYMRTPAAFSAPKEKPKWAVSGCASRCPAYKSLALCRAQAKLDGLAIGWRCGQCVECVVRSPSVEGRHTACLGAGGP